VGGESAGPRHQNQPGPMDPMRREVTKDSGEEAELLMCNREMKIRPKVKREEEIGAQGILKRPPAA